MLEEGITLWLNNKKKNKSANDEGVQDKDHYYEAINNDYASKYLESIGVRPTKGRVKEMVRRSKGELMDYCNIIPKWDNETEEGRGISKHDDIASSIHITPKIYNKCYDNNNDKSEIILQDKSKKIGNGRMLDMTPPPPSQPIRTLSNKSNSDDVLCEQQQQHMVDIKRDTKRRQEGRLVHNNGGIKQLTPSSEIITNELEQLRAEGQRIRSIGNTKMKNIVDTMDNGSNINNIMYRFIWPFAYFNNINHHTSQDDIKSNRIDGDRVWGRYSRSDDINIINIINNDDIIDIITKRRITVTISQVEKYMLEYITHHYPNQLLKNTKKGRRKTTTVNNDHYNNPGEPPPIQQQQQQREQFGRICVECELPRLAGLLAHLAYWLMFHIDYSDDNEVDYNISPSLPLKHRHALILTILYLWQTKCISGLSSSSSSSSKVCDGNNSSIDEGRYYCSYWLPRCMLLLKITVSWILLEYNKGYDDDVVDDGCIESLSDILLKNRKSFSSSSSSTPSPLILIDARINAMFRVLFDAQCNLSRFPILERYQRIPLRKVKDMIRMAKEADITTRTRINNTTPTRKSTYSSSSSSNKDIMNNISQPHLPPPPSSSTTTRDQSYCKDVSYRNTHLLRVALFCNDPNTRKYVNKQQEGEQAHDMNTFLDDWLYGITDQQRQSIINDIVSQRRREQS